MYNNNTCQAPEGVDANTFLATASAGNVDCELAAALDLGSEIWGYRGSSPDPDGVQWQQCWNETQSSKFSIPNHTKKHYWRH
jgi:hypothetical protein